MSVCHPGRALTHAWCVLSCTALLGVRLTGTYNATRRHTIRSAPLARPAPRRVQRARAPAWPSGSAASRVASRVRLYGFIYLGLSYGILYVARLPFPPHSSAWALGGRDTSMDTCMDTSTQGCVHRPKRSGPVRARHVYPDSTPGACRERGEVTEMRPDVTRQGQ